MLRPGGAWWLLKHEVRMFLIDVTGTRKNASGKASKKSIVLWLVLGLGLHAAAYALLSKLGAGAAGDSSGPPHALVVAVTGIMAGAFTLMLSTGLRSSVEVLFERGDLDLLLSSPLPSRSIFTARLAGIAAGTCGLYLFFLTPFAHAGALLGQWHWFGIYPAILSMAAIAASLSMLLTLALVRWLGVRRTRVVAQILGALAGAFFFLMSQAYSAGLRDFTQRMLARLAPLLEPGAALGPGSLVWTPSLAAMGSPSAALLLSLAAGAVFLLTVRFTHRFFVHGLQQAASAVRVAKAPPGGLRFRFGRSLTHTVVVKEWRLILRDPQLISQVLLQLLYLLPLCLPLFTGRAPSLPGTGAALTFLCAALTASLGWLIISAEDAPDLLRAAPGREGAIRRAKLLAVVAPPMLLVLTPLAWFAVRQPQAAALMFATALLACVCVALVVLWCGRPAPRREFARRGKSNLVGTMLELLSSAAWAGLAFVLLARLARGNWSGALTAGALFSGLAALALLGAAWALRRKAD